MRGFGGTAGSAERMRRCGASATPRRGPTGETGFPPRTGAEGGRVAAHHVPDVLAALLEMTRVARHRVVICDNVFVSESSEEADRLRDPSHVRNYGAAEWHSFFELAGLRVAEEAFMVRETG